MTSPHAFADDNGGAPERSGDTVSALERGVSLLRCFTETRRVLTPTELSRLSSVPRPTVTRLATTLVNLGLLKQEPDSDGFMLGPGLVSLARVFLAGLDVRAAARPHMQVLADDSGGSVFLAVPDGLEMVIVEACRPRSTLMAARLDVGSRTPMATSALGRAWLWGLPPAARQAPIDALRRVHGPEWAALEPGLRRALAEADKLGWCISAGEFHREINSAGVPLLGPGGEAMALGCGTSAFVFTEDHLRHAVAPRLLQVARALAADIGGSVPPAH